MAEEGQLKKFIVDVVSTKVDTYEVMAPDHHVAKDMWRDGVIVHSEHSGDAVQTVQQAI